MERFNGEMNRLPAYFEESLEKRDLQGSKSYFMPCDVTGGGPRAAGELCLRI
jgi:hypothetical protein